MSPTLATRTTDPGVPAVPDPPGARRDDTPTRLDELIAELAIAEKWPTPAGYCHRCGLAPCVSTSPDVIDCDPGVHQVQTLEIWADLGAWGALAAAGVRHAAPGRRDLVLALARAVERIA